MLEPYTLQAKDKLLSAFGQQVQNLLADQQQATQGKSMSKKRVLFLCTGNSCRSQMAEGLVNFYWSEQWIPSGLA